MIPEAVMSGNPFTIGPTGYGVVPILIAVLVAGRAVSSSGEDCSTKPVPDRDGELG